ncbi:hypothetical protein GCM10010123_17140 [Pilimelia anulata]|uniref:Membrane protein insertase YidC n=1 Tax=Pilimelia anulata TaxID=53371 RepID=A0A8J3B8Q1_9ACTN|nr:membrane protein insertase YidC [Pilimelia anulata]GGJ88115.1 hypothetical protein GCM10010123_17140 [Pilimelia anulata]
MSLDWLYTAISWILLSWHSVWNAVGLGNNGAWILAIVFVVVTLRVILFPLFMKSIKSQRAVQALAPKVTELREKHKDDPQKLQQEVMALYRTEKANPLGGCLPMLIQAPVFLALFHVLRFLDPTKSDVKFKTLYGWSLDQFEHAVQARLFGAPIAAKFGSTVSDLAVMNANALTVKLVAGVLVALMIATTYLTTKQMILKTGWAAEPQQRMIQKIMLYGFPASLLISGAIFPIGVIIYWVVQNIFSLAQQQWVLRKYPPLNVNAKGEVVAGAKAPPSESAKALAPKPGARPANPKKGTAKRKG